MIAVNIHQTVQVDDELEIRAYYAGHVRLLAVRRRVRANRVFFFFFETKRSWAPPCSTCELAKNPSSTPVRRSEQALKRTETPKRNGSRRRATTLRDARRLQHDARSPSWRGEHRASAADRADLGIDVSGGAAARRRRADRAPLSAAGAGTRRRSATRSARASATS